MLNRKKTNLAISLSCIAFGIATTLGLPAFAEEKSFFDTNAKLGFFNHDSVVNLNSPLEYSNQQDIEFGPTKGFDLSKDFKLSKASQNREDTQPAEQEIAEQIPEGADPQEHALRKEFGDPSEAIPVKGVDSAPKPYKAMLKAIDMGRDDLALEYANQWMGYMKSLERVTKKASSISQVAVLSPEQIATNVSPQMLADIDPAGLQAFIKKQQQSPNFIPKSEKSEIDSATQERINGLFGELDQESNPQSASVLSSKDEQAFYLVNKSIDPQSRRAMIRTKLASQLPVNPDGLVKILFFMKPSDSVSLAVAKEISSALNSADLKVALSIVPLSLEPLKPNTSAEFVNATGIPALLRDGVSIAKSLNINDSPALVFTTSSSSKIFTHYGWVDSVFIEEVSKIIGGK